MTTVKHGTITATKINSGICIKGMVFVSFNHVTDELNANVAEKDIDDAILALSQFSTRYNLALKTARFLTLEEYANYQRLLANEKIVRRLCNLTSIPLTVAVRDQIEADRVRAEHTNAIDELKNTQLIPIKIDPSTLPESLMLEHCVARAMAGQPQCRYRVMDLTFHQICRRNLATQDRRLVTLVQSDSPHLELQYGTTMIRVYAGGLTMPIDAIELIER